MAGKQAGFAEDSGTRSSLLWQVKRLLLECREIGELPQCLVMENVEALVNKKNMPDFQKWLDFLDSMGYKSYWNKMNSKDFGVPQNRSRVLMCSLLSDLPYVFPEPIPLKKRLKDVLEKNVDEKYYINNEKAEKLIIDLMDRGTLPCRERERTAYLNYNTIAKVDVEVGKTLCARDYKGFGTGYDTMNGVIENS